MRVRFRVRFSVGDVRVKFRARVRVRDMDGYFVLPLWMIQHPTFSSH